MRVSSQSLPIIESLRARLAQVSKLHAPADAAPVDTALIEGHDVDLIALLQSLERVLTELLANERKYMLFQKRFAEILEFACSVAQLDFSKQLELRGEYDEMDAVCMSLNMLSEELESSTLSRDEVQAIFNAIPDAILVFDVSGCITQANVAAGLMFGCEVDDLLQHNVGELIRVTPAGLEQLLREIEDHPLRDRELEFPSARDPQVARPVSLAAAAIRDARSVTQSYVWIAKDITRRKRLEEQLKRNRDAALLSSRLKSEFLANMSHEIRTPMNGVMGMLDLLLDTELSRNQEELTQTAFASANVLLEVLNDILDFSKIEAGKLDFESVDFELQTVVDETIQILALRAQDKDLVLTGLVFSDRPVAVKGDPGRLRQVFINLVNNAIKFTEEGEVSLHVHLGESTDPDEVCIRAEVKDTGIGIPPDQVVTIFEPFSQADGSTTRTHGGTGLGLAICRQIVSLMGGEIGVHSEHGVSSTFWFTARFRRGTLTEGLAEQAAALAGRRLMLVNHGAPELKILEYYAESWAMGWRSAKDGKTALLGLREAARDQQPFDVLLVDKGLPDVDGASLAQFIRLDPEIPTPRLVLSTTVGSMGTKEMERLGIDAQLNKPVRRVELLRTLAGLFHGPVGEPRVDDHRAHGPVFMHSRVLLVEDNVVNAMVASRQLTKLGCEVDVAQDGIEAIEAIHKGDYRLVFMDCQMPRLDGYEATQRIRAQLGRKSTVPIVAMTANALDGERDKCIAAGMDDYLSKPITRAELVAILNKWLDANRGRGLSG